jgi:poly(A) polymerase
LGKKRFLTEFSDITLLKVAGFFHDIGKPYTRKENFLHHEKVGEKIFKKIGKSLALGKEATEFVSGLILHHLDIFRLFLLHEEGNLNRERINTFWYENKNNAVYLFILSLADAYATSEDKYYFEKLREFIIYLQTYYFDVYLKEIVEEPLLSGREIMDILGLKPSPEVGKIKKLLLKEQIKGKIKNKEEAKMFVKYLRG